MATLALIISKCFILVVGAKVYAANLPFSPGIGHSCHSFFLDLTRVLTGRRLHQSGYWGRDGGLLTVFARTDLMCHKSNWNLYISTFITIDQHKV